MRAVITQVERWRAKADELCAVADTLGDAAARDQLLQMAEGYDRLANGRVRDQEARGRHRTALLIERPQAHKRTGQSTLTSRGGP